MFLNKWPPVAILDVQKSPYIAFLTISDQYHNFNFCEKMFTKWLPAAILDVWKSLSVAFLAISDQYETLLFFKFYKNGRRRPFWMSEIHFGSHFLAILDQYRFFFQFLTKWLSVAILDVRKSLSISFLAISDRYATLICFEIFDKIAAEIHFGSHFWPF